MNEEVKFEEIGLTIATSPSWWRGFCFDVPTPQAQWVTVANVMIPFIDNRRGVAGDIFYYFPDQLSFYDPKLLKGSGSLELDRRLVFANHWAEKMPEAFARLLQLTGKTATDLGPGYVYLLDVARIIRGYRLKGGNGQLTPIQTQGLVAELRPLLSYGDNAEFVTLAKSFASMFLLGSKAMRHLVGDPVWK